MKDQQIRKPAILSLNKIYSILRKVTVLLLRFGLQDKGKKRNHKGYIRQYVFRE